MGWMGWGMSLMILLMLNELKVMVTVLMMRMNMMKTTIVVIVMMMTSCIKPGTSLTISLCSTSNITT